MKRNLPYQRFITRLADRPPLLADLERAEKGDVQHGTSITFFSCRGKWEEDVPGNDLSSLPSRFQVQCTCPRGFDDLSAWVTHRIYLILGQKCVAPELPLRVQMRRTWPRGFDDLFARVTHRIYLILGPKCVAPG